MRDSSHQPKSQPDFGAEFHTNNEAPVCYERRIYHANGLHDIIYLSSYLHDSIFRLDQVRLVRKTLVLPMDRARWELYRKSKKLKYIRSELRITHVLSFQVEMDDRLALGEDSNKCPQMIVRRLQCITDQWEDSDDLELIVNLVMGGKIRLRVAEKSSIRLLDSPI